MINELDRVNNKNLGTTSVYYGEVISVEDKARNGIIRVRIPNLDNNVSDSDLPPCYPIFNLSFFRVIPKIGERVYVQLSRTYTSDKTANQEKRYWTSISISQPQNINYDPYYYTANSHESDGWVATDTPVTEIPEARGTYGDTHDIAIYGRQNVDILLKNSQLLLRAGRHLSNQPTTFNRTDPAYILLKHGNENPTNQEKKKTTVKVVNIDPTHDFNILLSNDQHLMIKVVEIVNSRVLESYTKTLDSRELAIADIKAKLNSLKQTYPLWRINTTILELQNLPKIFPNNKKVIRETITENFNTNQNQGSVINLVGDKINILSHKTNNYNLTDPTNTITPDEQKKINSESHPLAYGDKLIEFMELMKNFVANHVHGYHGVEPAKDSIVQKILNYDLNQLINENIRIN